MIEIGTATTDSRLPELRAALGEQRKFRIAQLNELADKPANARAALGTAVDDVGHVLKSGAMFALAEIEAALKRIDSGRYGVCVACEGAIAIERLEVSPMAALCLRCYRRRGRRANLPGSLERPVV